MIAYVDSALPKVFSRVHRRHRSPHAASNLVAILGLLLLALLVVNNADSSKIYGMAAGIGGIGVVALMALVSYSVIFWFAKNGVPQSENVMKTFIAPGISAVVLTLTATFGMLHLELVVGGEPGEYSWVVSFLFVAFVVGVVLALYFRIAKPEVYRKLGRVERVSEMLADRGKSVEQQRSNSADSSVRIG